MKKKLVIVVLLVLFASGARMVFASGLVSSRSVSATIISVDGCAQWVTDNPISSGQSWQLAFGAVGESLASTTADYEGNIISPLSRTFSQNDFCTVSYTNGSLVGGLDLLSFFSSLPDGVYYGVFGIQSSLGVRASTGDYLYFTVSSGVVYPSSPSSITHIISVQPDYGSTTASQVVSVSVRVYINDVELAQHNVDATQTKVCASFEPYTADPTNMSILRTQLCAPTVSSGVNNLFLGNTLTIRLYNAL